ncbi:hypothetical protein P692DRAFT_20592773 [Suillus brevipes Sb2]|nr:hypothetical protein P692DRAFT_20592773 [Suillus brevipes Sb2]
MLVGCLLVLYIKDLARTKAAPHDVVGVVAGPGVLQGQDEHEAAVQYMQAIKESRLLSRAVASTDSRHGHNSIVYQYTPQARCTHLVSLRIYVISHMLIVTLTGPHNAPFKFAR